MLSTYVRLFYQCFESISNFFQFMFFSQYFSHNFTLSVHKKIQQLLKFNCHNLGSFEVESVFNIRSTFSSFSLCFVHLRSLIRRRGSVTLIRTLFDSNFQFIFHCALDFIASNANQTRLFINAWMEESSRTRTSEMHTLL